MTFLFSRLRDTLNRFFHGSFAGKRNDCFPRAVSPAPLVGVSANRGFTLLEVLVALTIVGMVLGSLFVLLGGSKRLAWKAKMAVEQTAAIHSLLYALSLGIEDLPILKKNQDGCSLRSEQVVPPERKTKPMNYELVHKVISRKGRDISLWYWRHNEVPK